MAARVKVAFFEAKPNPMFPDQITALLRFARPVDPIVCVACGRSRRKLWTMLCAFRCGVTQGFEIKMGIARPALTLVCDDHPINPTEEVIEAMNGDREIDAPLAVADPEIKPGDFSMSEDEDDGEESDEEEGDDDGE